MAAPSPAASRPSPGGIRLDFGHSTVVSFSRKPTVGLWTESPKPPGLDGGEGIKTTTMHNLVYHTKRPQELVMITDGTFTAAYDPQAYQDIMNDVINKEGVVTVFFPDNSTYCFFGYLSKFEPQALKQGEQPKADCTIVVTNWDYANHLEAGPVMTQVSGT